MCKSCISSEITPYGATCWNCGVKSPGGRTCPRSRLPGTPSYVWLSTIYDGAASELLKTYKFGHLRAAAKDIASIMTNTLDSFFDQATVKTANYLVVPIPTATSRIRQRGFDHSQLMAHRVAQQLGLSYTPALRRLGQTRQVGSKRTVRLAQADDKYFVRLPALIKDRRVLLIDDVVTTGATLRAATKALRKAGALRVDALVFAKRL